MFWLLKNWLKSDFQTFEKLRSELVDLYMPLAVSRHEILNIEKQGQKKA
jgi:hypothetical protein